MRRRQAHSDQPSLCTLDSLRDLGDPAAELQTRVPLAPRRLPFSSEPQFSAAATLSANALRSKPKRQQTIYIKYINMNHSKPTRTI